MKVLFAIGDASTSENIVKQYYSLYGEKIEYKNVFYFKALLEEVKKDKTYDRIVIAEQLEPPQRNVVDAIDQMIFNNIDSITDEIEDSTIIFICSDGRTKNDNLIGRLFNIGIYNLLMGNERDIVPLCGLIKNPRNKKEAKDYLKINPAVEENSVTRSENEVEENELLNIIRYYNGLKTKEEFVEKFSIVEEQYNERQLQTIVTALSQNLKKGKEIYMALQEDPRYTKYCVIPNFNASNANRKEESSAKSGILGFLSSKKMKVNSNSGLSKAISAKEKISNDANDMADKASKEAEMMMDKAQQEAKMQAEQLRRDSEERRQREQQEAQLRAQQEAQLRAQQEAQLRAQQEAQLKAQQEAQLRAQQEAQLKAQQEAQLKAQQEAHLKAQQEAQLKAQQEAQLKAQQEAQLKAQQEAQLKAQQEAQLKAQQEAQLKAQQEAQLKAQQEAQLKAQQEAQLKAQQEAQLKAQQEAQLKAQQEAQLKAQQEAQLRAQQEAQLKAQQEAQLKAQQEAQLKAQQEAQLRAQQEAQQRAQEELARKEAELKAQQEAQLRAQQEAQLKAQQEAQLKAQQEAQLRAQQEAYANQNVAAGVQTMNDVDDSVNEIMNSVQQYVVPADYKKIVAFVGTRKVGTSFIVNSVANLLAMKGVKTSILDMTKNRGMYWFYNDMAYKKRDLVETCMSNLANGVSSPIPVGKYKNNLTLYTTVPGGKEDNRKAYKHRTIVDTAKKSCNLLIIDCDFSTPNEYLELASEIYVIQDLDLLKAQETLEFFRDLKTRKTDWAKLRLVLNNSVKCKITPKKIIKSALTYYNDPSMTFTEEFEEIKKYIEIPLEPANYANYLESMQDGKLSMEKFTPTFLRALEALSIMVYGLTNNKKKGLF